MSSLAVEEGESLWVVSFDGLARPKRKCGAPSAIIWKLLKWNIWTAAAEYAADLNVNEAEYRGLLLGFDPLVDQTRGHIVICGEDNLSDQSDARRTRLQSARIAAITSQGYEKTSIVAD